MDQAKDFLDVSVIVPMHNAEATIDETLACIEAQTYKNLEIIVVDDASTDSSSEIVGRHANQDGRITLLKQEKSNAGVARNNGMRIAKGKYLMFLDADDLFDPTMVELLVNRAQDADADVVVCGSRGLDIASGEICPLSSALHISDIEIVASGEDLASEMFRFCNGWPWDKIYKTDFIKREGLEFQSLRSTNDARFVFLALMLARRIAFVGQELITHRINNSQSLEGSRDKSWNNALFAVDALEDEISQRGIAGAFSDSFVKWGVDFLLWNYWTLSPSVRMEFLEEMLQRFERWRVSDRDEGFFYSELEGRICSFANLGHLELVDYSIQGAGERDYFIEELGRERARSQGLIDQLEDTSERLAQAEESLNQIRSLPFYSTASRIVHALLRLKPGTK